MEKPTPTSDFTPRRVTGADQRPTSLGDFRGPYGYGRRAHKPDPDATYIFRPGGPLGAADEDPQAIET